MITSQHQSSASNTRPQKPPPPPPPPPVSLKSTGSQTDAASSSKEDATDQTTGVQCVSIGLQVDLIAVDKVDVGTQYEPMEEVMETKEEDIEQPGINEANESSSQSIEEQTDETQAGNDVSDRTDKPIDSEMAESNQKLVEISEPESMQDESLLVIDSKIKEIKAKQAPVSSIEANESKVSSVQSQESDINETVSVVDSDMIVKSDSLVKNESDIPDVQSAPDLSLQESPPVSTEEKIPSIPVTIIHTTSSPSISTVSTISSSTPSSSTISPSPSTKRRPLKRPISSLSHSPDDIHPPSAKALHIDTASTISTPPSTSNTVPSTSTTNSTTSTSPLSNTIASTPPTTLIAPTSSISTSSSATSTQVPVVPTSSTSCTVSVSTSEAVVHSPLSETDDSFSIVSIPVSSITNLPTPKKNPTVVIHSVASTISDSTSVSTTTSSVLYSTAVAALISPSPLSPISPSPFSPSPISSCPLSPSPVPESPPKTAPKADNPPSPSKSSSSQQPNPIIPPITSQDSTTVNTESITHSFTATSTDADIVCTGGIDVAPSSVSTETKSLEPSSIETVQELQSQPLQTVSVLKEEGKEEIKEEFDSIKEEVFESIKEEEEEEEKMETEDIDSTGDIFNFTSIPNSKGILPLKPELFQTVSSLSSSSPHRESSTLILSSANPNTITSVPSIEELSSSISSPGGDNLFFPDSAGPHFPPSHSSTPTSPFPSTVIPDENVLLEAVTNELGVDSIDPSLLNMSDLLSLLQPDSDPLDQLALTTEEASSDMIVLQQSDGMNVVQNLDLNINEEELLEGLPQELRDSVQAMLEDQ